MFFPQQLNILHPHREKGELLKFSLDSSHEQLQRAPLPDQQAVHPAVSLLPTFIQQELFSEISRPPSYWFIGQDPFELLYVCPALISLIFEGEEVIFAPDQAHFNRSMKQKAMQLGANDSTWKSEDLEDYQPIQQVVFRFAQDKDNTSFGLVHIQSLNMRIFSHKTGVQQREVDGGIG